MMKKMAMCVDDKVEAELELARQDAENKGAVVVMSLWTTYVMKLGLQAYRAGVPLHTDEIRLGDVR